MASLWLTGITVTLGVCVALIGTYHSAKERRRLEHQHRRRRTDP